MARRQRKTSPIPTARISEVFTSSDELEEEISEDEKRRLIEQSGILGIVDVQKVTTSKSPAPVENAPDFADEVFYATLLLIPMAFLYVIMDIVIHQQYAQQATFMGEAKRLIANAPFLAVFIFYTNRYKASRITQLVLFLLAVACGSALIYQVNRARWTDVMQQAAPLSTLWTYAVIQLDLLPCGASLLIVYGITKYLNLSLGLA